MKNTLTVLGSVTTMAVVLIIAIKIGALIAQAAILGFFSALGLIIIAFRSPLLMKILLWSTLFIDIAIFVGGILATIFLGVTIAASLVFTGVFYTMAMKCIEPLAEYDGFRRKYELDEPIFRWFKK